MRGEVAGAPVTGQMRVSGEKRAAARVAARMNVTGMDIGALRVHGIPDGIRAALNFDMNVTGAGRSADAILRNLDGEAFLFTADARLRDIPLDSLVQDLDIFTVFSSGGGPYVHLNCAIATFEIHNGVAHTEATADTDSMILRARGSIDMPGNQLKLELEPSAKSDKLSAAPIPVDIVGPLDDPQIDPKMDVVIGNVIGGVLGGLLFPINQLIASSGTDNPNTCGPMIQRAKSRPTYSGDQG